MTQSLSTPELPPVADAGALATGLRLDGLEIERLLARSAFGLVYLARDSVTGAQLAVKEYLPTAFARRRADGVNVELREPAHAAAFGRGLQAFIDEARLFERVAHPSLLHVQRCFEAHGSAYRVMPYYPGHRLLDIRRGMDEPPDEPALRGLLEGLLGALEALHATRAIHGDIHPGSILLLPDDRPVLLDGGAVQRAIEGEDARTLIKLMGPAFAAPEQRAAAPGASTGPWTDLYALAAVVRYCIGGRLPEPGSLQMSAAGRSLTEVLREQAARHPHLRFSPQFIAAIETALAPQPQDRPQNVAEMRAALDGQTPAVPATADELIDENNEAVRPAAARETAAAAPATPARPQPTPPEQVRTLAALQLALDTIATDAPAGTAARTQPMYASSERPDKRPDGPLQRPSGRPAALWTIAGAALVVVAVASAWLVMKRSSPELRLVEAQAPAAEPAAAASAPVGAETTPEPAAAPAPTATAAAEPGVAVVAPAPAASQATVVNFSPPAAGPDEAASTPAVVATLPRPARPAAPVEARPAAKAAPEAPPKPAATPKPVAKPVARPADKAVAATTPTARSNPRDVCGERTPFALYRCMQAQCKLPQWVSHAQCVRLREHDEVN